MEYSRCPVSIYAFDKEVMQVNDLFLTYLELGIPVVEGGLLDQTPAFFNYTRIIRDEKATCHEELEKLRKEDERQAEAKAKRGNRVIRKPAIR